VLGVLALLPAAFAVLGIVGLVKWLGLPAQDRHFDEVFWMLAAALAVGGTLALGLAGLALRALRNTDFRGYNPKDPDQTHLKW